MLSEIVERLAVLLDDLPSGFLDLRARRYSLSSGAICRSSASIIPSATVTCSSAAAGSGCAASHSRPSPVIS
jgi:hypothetical protein